MTWDIVDKLEPTVQITVKNPKRSRTVKISSLAQVALILTTGFASSHTTTTFSHSTVKPPCATNATTRKATQSVSSAVPRGVVRDTDTQFGQSSSKLARAFPAFFQPASDEAQNDEDDYSFA